MIVTINAIEYAAGLIWSDDLKKTSPYVEVVSSFIVGDHSGIQYGHIERGAKEVGLQSIGAILAQTRSDGIFVARLDNDTGYCCCVIVDSLVVEGSDVVLKTPQDTEEWLGNYEGSSDIVGVNGELSEFGVSDFVELSPSVLETCVVSKSAYGTNYNGLIKLLIIIALITGCYVGFNKWEDHQKEVKIELAKQAAAEEIKRIRKKAVSKVNIQDIEALKKSFKFIKTIPSYQPGWGLFSLSFNIETSTASIDYVNKGTGIEKDQLIETLSSIGRVSSMHYIKAGQNILVMVSTNVLSEDHKTELAFSSIADVQDSFFGLAIKLRPLKIILVMKTPPAGLASPGQWSMTAKDISTMSRGLKMLRKYNINGLSFDSVGYSSSKKITLKGSIYAQ